MLLAGILDQDIPQVTQVPGVLVREGLAVHDVPGVDLPVAEVQGPQSGRRRDQLLRLLLRQGLGGPEDDWHLGAHSFCLRVAF